MLRSYLTAVVECITLPLRHRESEGGIVARKQRNGCGAKGPYQQQRRQRRGEPIADDLCYDGKPGA